MELSSDLPGCCSSSPLVQSSLHSGNSTVSPSSPSISQPQRKVLNSSEDTTWNSVGFIQELHSKLVLVQAQREHQNITRLRRSNRRSFRFSPYGRSRSLCYLNVRSRNLAPRRASQNDSQKFVPVVKSVSSPAVSLKRKFDLVIESSQVATALTRELLFNAHAFISENTVDAKYFGKRLKQNDGTDVKMIVRSASLRKAESLRKLTQGGRIVVSLSSLRMTNRYRPNLMGVISLYPLRPLLPVISLRLNDRLLSLFPSSPLHKVSPLVFL